MRAVVLHAPFDLRVEEREPPSLGPGQVRVSLRAGGICGSDLHYYLHGGFGAVRLREPMILGHEVAGVIAEVASGVTSVKPGDTVAVNPSLACGACRYCMKGLHNHCLDMRFYGSAMRMPHVQGAFRDSVVCEAVQAVPMPEGTSVNEAAFAEPLAVCLHAVVRAGPLLGQRVLVTGAGPIGILTVAAARAAGAAEIVATDILDGPLFMARRTGADRTINVASEPEALAGYEAEKGWFDVMFEAAGSAVPLLAGLKAVRPLGTIVQIGQGAQADLPMSAIVTKEINLIGTFRFDTEFETAASFIARRQIDVRPLLTEIVPLKEAKRAFDLAADKSRSMKVQLALGEA
ncbi:L-idonate 5-dehydrogenase [Labrys okinawensis]|uniref:L-idonate 5-dehydrogenase n=1 Tax=Labrys okinawensis TaxID=346911 RepID=UPI0039BD04C2